MALSPTETARLNRIEPHACLKDVLARIHDHPIDRLDELLPTPCSMEPATLEAPDRASALELFHLSTVIERLMSDPARIVGIRLHLNLEQRVQALFGTPAEGGDTWHYAALRR